MKKDGGCLPPRTWSFPTNRAPPDESRRSRPSRVQGRGSFDSTDDLAQQSVGPSTARDPSHSAGSAADQAWRR
ncbi:hypothetical protein V6N13_108348 [Hibiscus sabdariffa]|uniref:Uncharacterized protein n=1 Tax=Hibiscus sabdariffa TaxID=183260 RepID=A0ABR2SSV4_9ROSI